MCSAVLGAFPALSGDFRAWPHVPDPTGFLVWRSSCDPQLQAAWLWAFSSQTLAFLACFSSDVLSVLVVRVKSCSIAADFDLVVYRALLLRLAAASICHARAVGLGLRGGEGAHAKRAPLAFLPSQRG